MKYRIKESTYKNGTKKYYIQKRYLWSWHTLKDGPVNGPMMDVSYSTLDRARAALKWIDNPVVVNAYYKP